MCLEKSNQIGKLFRYVKNLGKIILRKGVPDWTSVIHEVPIYPKMIYQHLTRLNIKYFKVFVKSNENDKLEMKNLLMEWEFTAAEYIEQTLKVH